MTVHFTGMAMHTYREVWQELKPYIDLMYNVAMLLSYNLAIISDHFISFLVLQDS